MRARGAAFAVTTVLALTACGRVPGSEPATPPSPLFSRHELPPSPSPLRVEVQSGDVQALIPDGWEAQPLPQARYPQQGLVAAPKLVDWERGPGTVGGMEAFWIDVASVRIPSDYYYMVARGPAIAALAGNKNCHPFSQEVVVDHPPDFTGRRFSPGDYVVSARGTCQTDGVPTKWAYIVAAPGFGPIRQVGIPSSGLYVVIAVVSGTKANAMLRQMIEGARFGDTGINQIVQLVRATA